MPQQYEFEISFIASCHRRALTHLTDLALVGAACMTATAGVTTRVSVDSEGREGVYGSGGRSISADGRYVAFISDASKLVPGDTNNNWDVFVHDRLATLLEGPHGTATCADGIDNDNDGNVDALDTDCALPPPPLTCNGKRATIVVGPGDDNFVATPNADIIAGGSGNDVLDGGTGTDSCNGQTGTDTHLGGCETLLSTP